MLVVVFVLQVANNALFLHSHNSGKGKTFSHAHPFSSHHSHNDFQIIFFNQLQLLDFNEAPQLVKECFFTSYYTYKNYTINYQAYNFHLNLKNKAPPMC